MSTSATTARQKNLELKLAIFEAGKNQRAVAIAARIGETRLSDIVRRRGVPPTKDEKEAIAKVLGKRIREIFRLDDAA